MTKVKCERCGKLTVDPIECGWCHGDFCYRCMIGELCIDCERL